MAPILATIEPTTATAGATWTWSTSSSTYSVADGWTLSYAVLGAGKLTWDAAWVTESGETRTIVIPPASTAKLSAGRYEVTRIWTGSGTYAGRVDFEPCDPLTVAPDPTTAAPGDRVAFAEANLAAVEAAITARLKGDEPEEYTIGGRSVRKIDLKQLQAMRGALSAELWRLRNPGRAFRSMGARFSAPSA